MTGAQILETQIVGFSASQITRLQALLDQIYSCEGDIIGPHWCQDCYNRWAKIWGLVARFKALNDVDRAYAAKILGLVGKLGTHNKERLGD